MGVEFEQVPDEAKSSKTGHRMGYFLWGRPAAKCLWILCAVFWGGGAAALFLPSVGRLYDNAVAGLLFSILFPPLVFLYLAIGWARQEIDAGRIVLGPADPPRDRSIGGWSDPASDPLDPRSGPYTRRIQAYHDRSY